MGTCFEEAKCVLGLIGSVLAFFSMDFLGISRGQSPSNATVAGAAQATPGMRAGTDSRALPRGPTPGRFTQRGPLKALTGAAVG